MTQTMIESQDDPGRFENAIIGESPQIRNVIATARKIAENSSITTLIVGESGTGKELVARLIHERSASAGAGPFIDINCGAIPETLLESELFGHEKGSFTDAHTRKKGLFELANSGTIFLDEIGNTTANLQMKLLKVLENKRFRRIGGVEEIMVTTRIITATNIDLREAVENGKFRQDLYYRLNVFQIIIPPLRERGDDVLILAQHFIDHFNGKYDRQVKGLAPSAVRLVKEYPWPGNIRQLKNAVERAVLVEGGEWIEAESLLLESERDRQKPAQARDPKVTRVEIGIGPGDAPGLPTALAGHGKGAKAGALEMPAEGIALEELERDIILSALRTANGNLSRAARLLKIKRGKLRYRLERLGITPRDIKISFFL
jgi:transcriptional regulator with PAS, ATPase and Fis domain